MKDLWTAEVWKQRNVPLRFQFDGSKAGTKWWRHELKALMEPTQTTRRPAPAGTATSKEQSHAFIHESCFTTRRSRFAGELGRSGFQSLDEDVRDHMMPNKDQSVLTSANTDHFQPMTSQQRFWGRSLTDYRETGSYFHFFLFSLMSKFPDELMTLLFLKKMLTDANWC